jgi:N-methylhydantoinase B
MMGGRDGATGAFVLNPGTAEERSLPAAAADVRLPRGSLFRICTPGGGGYGDPRRRSPSAVERDLREERITPARARELCGWGEKT